MEVRETRIILLYSWHKVFFNATKPSCRGRQKHRATKFGCMRQIELCASGVYNLQAVLMTASLLYVSQTGCRYSS